MELTAEEIETLEHIFRLEKSHLKKMIEDYPETYRTKESRLKRLEIIKGLSEKLLVYKLDKQDAEK